MGKSFTYQIAASNFRKTVYIPFTYYISYSGQTACDTRKIFPLGYGGNEIEATYTSNFGATDARADTRGIAVAFAAGERSIYTNVAANDPSYGIMYLGI